jgi:hypothetical protein
MDSISNIVIFIFMLSSVVFVLFCFVFLEQSEFFSFLTIFLLFFFCQKKIFFRTATLLCVLVFVFFFLHLFFFV